MWYRYTDSLREAIFRADAIRESEGMSTLSTRHVLLGISCFGAAAEILERLMVRDSLEQTVPRSAEPLPASASLSSLTPKARAVLETAYQEASTLGDNFVGTEHFLLSCLRIPDSEASTMLAVADVSHDAVARELLRLHSWRIVVPEGTSGISGMLLLWRKFVRGVRGRWRFVTRVAQALTQLATDPVVFSFLFTRQRLERPSVFFHRLRKRGLYFSRAAGGWVVGGYEDAQNVLRDPALSARRFDLAFPGRTPLPPLIEREFNTLYGGLSRQMIFLDAPEQTRLRSLVSRQFTPRVLSAMRTEIQQIANQLLDAVAGRTEIDLIADFSFPLPATVIARLLGVDDRNLTQFKTWSDAFVKFISASTSLAEDLRAYRSLEALTHYFRDAITLVRSRPPDTTLLSLLANAVDEDGSRLTDDEVIMNALLLLAAGHETTTHLIANGLLLLFQNPEALARLKEDPALMPGAVEEMLRCEGPVQWTNRIARHDFVFKGQEIKRGVGINVALAAANRDPVRFPDPDRFDINRTENKHMAFGYGAHFCLGAALARIETEIALNTLLRRFPDIQLVDNTPQWRHDFAFRAQKTLFVKLSPGSPPL
jgi:cytochrome P450